MRTLLVVLVLLLWTPVLGAIVIVASMLGVRDRPGGIYERCARAWTKALCAAAGVDLHLHDADRIVHDAARVYVANHISWFDIFALASVLPHYTFIAKSELERIPVFGRAARAVGIIFIQRRNRKAAFDSYKDAALQVGAGKSVVVCPEGTRGKTYSLRPFKKGPFVFAIAAGVPIIPCIVHGTIKVQPKGSFWILANRVDIHFLEPVPTAGYAYDDRDALMRIVWTRMADALRELYGVESRGAAIEREAVPTTGK